MPDDLLFQVLAPLHFYVRVTHSYWTYIVTIKHPAMAGREKDVQAALQTSDEIHVSRSDPKVYLFYKAERVRRWVCAVTRQLNASEGFLITTYPTDPIKEGIKIWPK